MIDNKAKKSKYIAGLPAYNAFILIVFIVGLSTIGYFILKSRAQSVVKPPLQGLIDRNHPPEIKYAKAVSGYVVNLNWKDIQPDNSSELITTSIDDAISQAKSLGLKLKIRLFTGSNSPEWAKKLGGSPVTYYEPVDQNVASYQIPRFWTTEFKQAYNDLQSKLAAKYDSSDEIREVVISRCMTIYTEPFVRGITDQKNVTNLLSAGYTVAADQACQREQIEAHGVWQRTHSSLALNSYQIIKTNSNGQPAVAIDPNYTLQIMDYCRNTLGERCTLENNSIREATTTNSSLGGDYTKIYEKIKALGPAITFQTAAPAKIGNLPNTLSWAIDQGANAVELPADYSNYSASELDSYNTRLINNSTSTNVNQSSTPTPTISPTPSPTSTPTPSPIISPKVTSSPQPVSSSSSKPAPPTGLRVKSGMTNALATWTVPKDNTAVVDYVVSITGRDYVAQLPIYSIVGLNPKTQYKISVRSRDKEGQLSDPVATDFKTDCSRFMWWCW